jgi:hypothetical protein
LMKTIEAAKQKAARRPRKMASMARLATLSRE